MPLSPYVSLMRSRIGHAPLMLSGVSAVIRDEEGRILLSRGHGDHEWSLIGGGVEIGEAPRAAIIREIREELSVDAVVDRAVDAYGGEDLFVTYPNGDQCVYVTTAFACRIAPDDIDIDTGELAEVRWFSPDELPASKIQPFARRILCDAGVGTRNLPVIDDFGNRLIGLHRPADGGAAMNVDVPCPLALVVVTSPRGVVFGFNRWRKRWELPGGVIESGETERGAAARELREETGIVVSERDLTYVGDAEFDLRHPDRRERAALFTVALDGIEPRTSEELTAVAWVDLSEPLASMAHLDHAIARWTVTRGASL